MLSLKEIKAALRNGPHAWPGGYPLYFVGTDGEALSFKAVRENWREVVAAYLPRHRWHSDWLIAAVTINWESDDVYCVHTNERIESAYREPE